MKSRIAEIFLVLFIGLWSSEVFSATGVAEGKVDKVYTYGGGKVLVTGFNFTGATCSNNGAFWVRGDHPQLSRILSNVLSAKATGATLKVVASIDNCWYPEILNDDSTYLFVQ